MRWGLLMQESVILTWTLMLKNLFTASPRVVGFAPVRNSNHIMALYGRRWKSMGEGEIWPPATQKHHSRWSPKYVYVTMSGISTIMQNFIKIGLGVSVLRMRDFAPLGTNWLGYFWRLVLQTPRRAHGFWRKIGLRQTTRFRARKCLLGVAKPISKVFTPIFPKAAIFGPDFDGTNFFSPENGFNIGQLDSKRPLIVVVAQQKLRSEKANLGQGF